MNTAIDSACSTTCDTACDITSTSNPHVAKYVCPVQIKRINRSVLDQIRIYAPSISHYFISSNGQSFQSLTYNNQLIIPNKFKASCYARRSIIVHMRHQEPQSLPMKDIIDNDLHYKLHVHIINGKVDLMSREISNGKESADIFLDWRTSWEFSAAQLKKWEFTLKGRRMPLTILFEIIEPEACPYPTINYAGFNHSLLQATEEEKSVVWNRDAETVFIASRFAFNIKIAIPIQIVLLCDGGGAEMDTLICPRTRIINFVSGTHGIKEDRLIGQMDEYVAINMLRSKIHNKILIGFDVHKQIKRLRIDPTDLAGIREIKTNLCFGSQMSEKVHWQIQFLIRIYLNENVRYPIHDAYLEADLVRRLFIKMENKWLDDVTNILHESVTVSHLKQSSNVLESVEDSETFIDRNTRNITEHKLSDTPTIKEEAVDQSQSSHENLSIFDTVTKLEQVREFERCHLELETCSCKLNGFWVPPWESRNDPWINAGVTRQMDFFPPCHVWVQYYDGPQPTRLSYLYIPPIESRTNDDYFEIFYVPDQLQNIPILMWSAYRDRISIESRDYLVIRQRVEGQFDQMSDDY